MDCSPPGSSIHGILQARTLEWVAISSTRKADHCLQKQVGKNIKDEKGDKGGGEGAPSWEGKPVLGREARPGKGILRREVSKHQETLSLPSLWRALETQRAT